MVALALAAAKVAGTSLVEPGADRRALLGPPGSHPLRAEGAIEDPHVLGLKVP